MIAPGMVSWLTLSFGWRAAFLATGSIGFLWVAAFLIFRYTHPQMAHQDETKATAPKTPWMTLVRYRQTWAVFFCRFLADPLWYFYVFWIPEFLTRERGLDLAAIGKVAWIPFLVADISNFAGGYVTLRLQRAGWSVNRTRKTLMVLATVLSLVGILAVYQQSLF
jgi:ACS family hexuronate transporter-like MFS transporter